MRKRLAANLSDVVFTLALFAVAAGFFWAWAPLGLIVPGAVIIAIQIWTQARAEVLPPERDEPPEEGEPDA